MSYMGWLSLLDRIIAMAEMVSRKAPGIKVRS
jgi:hypothetical protein